jgi:Lrp/AsnC family leucine-responsive transcriptional regulator
VGVFQKHVDRSLGQGYNAREAKNALHLRRSFASLFRGAPDANRPSGPGRLRHRHPADPAAGHTTPQRTIGEAVNLSAPAVQRRIKRMEQNGVIRQNTALLDPAKVGQPITIFVEVEVESEKAELIDALKQSFAAAPEVQQCYYVTGEADFVLVVLVPDMAHYERLTRRLFFDSGNVRKFRTFVAMDNVKSTLSVPL